VPYRTSRIGIFLMTSHMTDWADPQYLLDEIQPDRCNLRHGWSASIGFWKPNFSIPQMPDGPSTPSSRPAPGETRSAWLDASAALGSSMRTKLYMATQGQLQPLLRTPSPHAREGLIPWGRGAPIAASLASAGVRCQPAALLDGGWRRATAHY
jgi:hypothetical protein